MSQSLKVDLYIMSAKYFLAVPIFHFWRKLTHLQRGLSAIAEHLVACQQHAEIIAVTLVEVTVKMITYYMSVNNIPVTDGRRR